MIWKHWSFAWLVVVLGSLWLEPTVLQVWAQAPATAAHPLVPGFARFPAKDDAQQVAAGELLLGELGCVTCHAADEKMAAYLPKKQAPVLTQVGGRVRVEWLRKFIADPASTKPGTTMPNPWSGIEAQRKQASVEALTHYLALTGSLAETTEIGRAHV